MTEKNGASRAAADQHSMIGVVTDDDAARSYKHTTHPDAQWFGNAGLGLFLHWGISSVHGGIDLSWGMVADMPSCNPDRLQITPEDYFKLADRFNPQKYDPAKWLDAAADAGFKYAVLTTRHHDGYAMWPTKHGSFGVAQYLGGRDLVRPYVEACRKAGLKVGLYYSPPDWYFNRKYMSFHYGSGGGGEFQGREHYGLRHEPIGKLPLKPETFRSEFRDYVRGQIAELLTGYGKVDVLFFDGSPESPPFMTLDEVRAFQPGVVINPRLHGYGDYETPECAPPAKRPAGWWERCDVWNQGGWGYAGEGYHPTPFMIGLLVMTRAWGGNLLINCAPRPTGEMPDLYYSRLSEVKAWMAHSRESVFDTRGGPWPEECNVPVTIGPNAWYLHFTPRDLNWMIPYTEEARVLHVQKPSSVRLLRTGEAIPFRHEAGTLTVSLPPAVRTDTDDVVAVAW